MAGELLLIRGCDRPSAVKAVAETIRSTKRKRINMLSVLVVISMTVLYDLPPA
jgi:hypothetical protein